MTFSIEIVDMSTLKNPDGTNFSPGAQSFTSNELIEIKRAATDWAGLLANNDFAPVLAGTHVKLKNHLGVGNDYTLESPVNDVVIFVAKGTTGTPSTIAQAYTDDVKGVYTTPANPNNSNIQGNDYDYLKARYFGIKYQPSFGSITFNNQNSNIVFSTASSTPNGEYDLYTVSW
jgi:hypothetical protein